MINGKKNRVSWNHHSWLDFINITNHQLFMKNGHCPIGMPEHGVFQIYLLCFVDIGLAIVSRPRRDRHDNTKGKPNGCALDPAVLIQWI